VLSDTELISKLLTGVMYKHSKCNEDIYFDDKYKTKKGIHIPMDPDTGKYHKCKTTVHKRKGMLRVLNKTQVECYKTLGLYPGATAKQINIAFEDLIREWHPDRMPLKGGNCTCTVCTPEQRAKKYREIIEAHNNIRLIYVADE
jgi:hypothetical protein